MLNKICVKIGITHIALQQVFHTKVEQNNSTYPHSVTFSPNPVSRLYVSSTFTKSLSI